MIPLTQIYIIVGIFAVFGVAAFMVARRWPVKAKQPAPGEVKAKEALAPVAAEAISKEGEINCRIIDVVTRTVGNRHVELVKGKNYGRQWTHLGKPVYYLRRLPDEALVPVLLPPRVKETPGELYGSFQVEQPLKNTLGPQESQSERTKLFMIVILAGIALFVDMVILVYKGTGG